MQPDVFLQLAERLLRSGKAGEADWRAVGHLCYYAVFHLLMERLGIDRSAYQPHALLRQAVNEAGLDDDALLKEAKIQLSRLYEHRVWADYDIRKTFTENLAEVSLYGAKRIFGASG